MEEKSVQGTQIKLTVRRRDYFFRAKHFRDSVLMVAEDNGVLLGVMGMAFMRLRVGGTFHKGALIFDWRANPEISDRGLNPVMGRIWLALDAVARDRGVEFLFGLVKKDNERSKRILSRGGAQYVGTEVLSVSCNQAEAGCGWSRGLGRLRLCRGSQIGG